MTIDPCPQCGHEAVIKSGGSPANFVGYRVRCRHCGTAGPLRLQAASAIDAWAKSIGQRSRNKYQREIRPGVWVDVYDVLAAFNVTCPAMAHAIKKCLAPGQRGVKDSAQDKREAIASIDRSIEMESLDDV